MINIPYVIALPKLEEDEGCFLFLTVERAQKFRKKKPGPPIGGTG